MQLPFLIEETLLDSESLSILTTKRRMYSEPSLFLEEKSLEISGLKDALRSALYKTLKKMSGLRRDLICLSFFYEMSHHEMAFLFNCSQVNISYHIVKGLEEVKKSLGEDDAFMGAMSRLRSLEGEQNFYY